eukprot:CAMPEP_0175093692 /NCGR_PEP_ID=MMETSP0086_2-20121207/3164_1 /TAXON_ID=136419 /ORGANISM="Unknown Unknown, Strain D1" /LENGTH=61 /DNA_ID=CAMNT_0016366703 /DNA_START=120 /DNA_END=305 /DNA_ORIENTATION=-
MLKRKPTRIELKPEDVLEYEEMKKQKAKQELEAAQQKFQNDAIIQGNNKPAKERLGLKRKQ